MNRTLALLGLLLPLVIPPSCMGRRVLHVLPADALRTHFLLDYDFREDPEKLYSTMGHLLLFNPGDAVANLTVTAYFPDREPLTRQREARAGATTEFNCTTLEMPRNSRFALRVESSQPVICQATEGWTNTGNVYDTSAVTRSPRGARETAKSAMSITSLATRWFVADGYVIDTGGRHWIRESEWALLLNPGDEPARVTMSLSVRAGRVRHEITVPARRLTPLFMDDLAPHNQHYGAEFNSDRPIAVQWRREVYWAGSDELMAFWSVPCVALSEPGPSTAALR